ncbi:MAG: hypothetical protein R2708_22750 [Vicinamibacterales bacterium]
MLKGNLATRPFYNERLVRTVLVAVLAAAVAWSALNAATLVSLVQQSTMLSERVRSEGLRASGARNQADVVRRGLDVADLRVVSGAATEANALIARRTFSWTALFNHLEATLPPNVRLVEVQPQADEAGRLMVSLTVVSRRIEDLDEFILGLEGTGAFRGVLSRTDEALDDGTIASSLQGYYVPLAEPETAGTAPASSEPKSVSATPAAPEARR